MKEFEITLEYPPGNYHIPHQPALCESMIFRTSPGGSHGIVPQEGTLIKLRGKLTVPETRKALRPARLIPSLKLTAKVLEN